MAGGTTSVGQSGGGQRRPLEGCWVTLAALDGDPEERAHVHDMVRQAGGRIFDAKRVGLVASPACAYAVCPLSFPPERLAEAARQPDFKLGARARPRSYACLSHSLPYDNVTQVCHEHRWHSYLRHKMTRTKLCASPNKRTKKEAHPCHCSAGGQAGDALLGGAQHRHGRPGHAAGQGPRDLQAPALPAAPARHGGHQVRAPAPRCTEGSCSLMASYTVLLQCQVHCDTSSQSEDLC